MNGGKNFSNVADAGSNYELRALSGGTTTSNLGYCFIAGMNENDSPDSGMAFDAGYETASKKPNHDKFGNVCFVDGSVRQYAGDNWQASIAYYGSTDTAFPKMQNDKANPGNFFFTSNSHASASSNIDGKLLE